MSNNINISVTFCLKLKDNYRKFQENKIISQNLKINLFYNKKNLFLSIKILSIFRKKQ